MPNTRTPLNDDLLHQAEADLVECAAPIDGDPDSPLDHNNLADLYRQMGDAARRNGEPVAVQNAYYAKAHAQLDQACAVDPSDPAFCHTRAMVYFSQRRYEDALGALEQCNEGRADQASAGDIEQYVVNQMLAAKLLLAATPDDAPPDLARITWVLERARQFTHKYRLALGDNADDLLATVEELLGDAYLQWPRREAAAVDAFDRLSGLKSGGPWRSSGALSPAARPRLIRWLGAPP